MKFLGYKVNGHMVAASCPATECVENIMQCEKNGAVAAILKSASSIRLHDEGERRCHLDKERKIFWSESGFDREILPLEKAVLLTKEALSQTNLLIIPSVTEMTLDTQTWLSSCKVLEQTGAHALQLDFFYFPEIMAEPGFNEKFVLLLKTLSEQCKIPIMPKLSTNFPALYAANLLKRAGIKYVSLLDSIRSPRPVNSDLTGKQLSAFGSWMFLLTRQYTDIMFRHGFEVCAGGGVTDGKAAAELMRLGATTVQVASEVLLHGFCRLKEIEEEMCHIETERSKEYVKYTGKRKAVFRKDLCIRCKKCTKQTFCAVAKELETDNSRCEGCGLCAALCETGAIIME